MALILLTNDDGYDALGFQSLYKALKNEFEVFAVVPRFQQSGASHSLTLRRPIRVEKLRDKFYTIDGTPTDCVLLAYHDLIKKDINLVVSGINHGPNMGSDVFYSGTVAAALQGATLGIKSIAVSMKAREYNDFKNAVRYIRDLIKRVLDSNISRLILNVNIPAGKIKGEKITRMGKRIYKDKVIRDSEKNDVMYSVIDGVLSYTVETDTDFKAVDEGYVSITPLKLDLTDYQRMKQLQERF
ncbi:5'/3'-nucleotidase SurE [candidate division WOR-3 bacterium 4484_100]|uniref:5'-nucleotidase SurE n=1 Tax=candidate division WOR-3 bacterium 4484_100 TaxID=1936077 RepID=A0A1V4QEC1_UNCW3|nr:MAG: 5'/3'-nucleotidase SurE [candidate division WOR-3 bacterium 4484_100]